MILKELKAKSEFRLRKNGAIWIKLYEQGMNNHLTYAVSKERTNTRCQRKSFKHKYLQSNREILPI